MRTGFSALLLGTMLSAPFVGGGAHAGEAVLYADIPGWVQPADIADLATTTGPAARLFDWQYRLEDSVVHAFTDRLVRIDNPEILMAENQLSLGWLPDKGDLIVHKLEIIRDGAVIDLVADGAAFSVIRREEGLEQRLLDGALTATLSVPGLRVGDLMRVAYTVTTDDQALGDEVQMTQYLPAAPWQVGRARAIVSWPQGEEMYWAAEPAAGLTAPEVRGGYNYLETELPLAESDPMPEDAPLRYRRPAVLRVGSFADWAELSRVMTGHFESAATLPDGSPVKAQAAAITRRAAAPLERASLAVQLVQDEVSYLLNGLEGGNYLPQSAEETWAKRFGDCKAKSVLLLALLREMGIESEVVLVSINGGDILSEVLPLPASFDHMIVRAVIDGQEYWLDGTSAATRLANIGDVPPFHYALPLRAGGSGLVPMVQRDPAVPQMEMIVDGDHSAGVDFPMLTDFTMTFSGPGGARLRAVADADDPDVLRELARHFTGGDDSQIAVSSATLSYDAAAGLATLRVSGIAPSEFDFSEGRLRMNLSQMSSFGQFNPDRARSAWRAIPVATAGPFRQRTVSRLRLPIAGTGHTLSGEPTLNGGFGTTSVTVAASIADGVLTTESETISRLGEIAPADLAEAKRAARRLASYQLEVLPPADTPWRWELSAADRNRRATPILAAYDRAIAFAESDDFTPLMARAGFQVSIYNFAGAKADYDRLIANEPSAWAYMQRASVLEDLGQHQAAIADLRTAYDLEPFNSLAFELSRSLAYAGETEEALALLENLPVSEEEQASLTDALATVTALGGDTQSGLLMLEDQIAQTPQNADALNSDCWYRGLFEVALDTALARCTLAVERAAMSAAALDSRALVHFRLGDFAGARRDLDAALALSPGLAESLYLRGIVRLRQGEREGRQDLATALRISPDLPTLYGRHGITPPE